MITDCNIIQDLIPIVKDGAATEQSKELVCSHLEHCEICRELYESYEGQPALDTCEQKDRIIVLNMKKSVKISQAMILCLGGIFATVINFSQMMFYNFLLLPILGVLSYIGYRLKWYVVPAFMMGAQILWSLGSYLIQEPARWYMGFPQGLIWGFWYAVFVLVGRGIAMLFQYAFTKK